LGKSRVGISVLQGRSKFVSRPRDDRENAIITDRPTGRRPQDEADEWEGYRFRKNNCGRCEPAVNFLLVAHQNKSTAAIEVEVLKAAFIKKCLYTFDHERLE
jgi:hypothetical protein